MCLAMHALKKRCHPSSLPFDWGVYTGENTCFTPNSSQIFFISLFLNSVPLSVRILLLPPKTQYTLSLYALQTVVAFLSGIATAMVNPVSMSITVNTYLFPLLLCGCIGPTRSIQINCIGKSGVWKRSNCFSGCPWFWS